MPDAALDDGYRVSSASSVASKRGAGYAVYDPLGRR
jgi:hypothetical protein